MSSHLAKLERANLEPMIQGQEVLLYWPRQEPTPVNWECLGAAPGPHGYWSRLIRRVR